MSINFPESLDSLTNPAATDSLAGHAQQHADVNDAIEAIEAKIGINDSQDENSIDYKLADIAIQLSSLDNNTDTITDLLGLEGNNDLVVTGIENKTAVDSFSKTLYSTVRYVIQITKGSEIVSESIDIVQDGSDFYVQQVEVSSNTDNDLATIQLEENSGIISLNVTPISGSVTARFYRTALRV